MTFEYRPHSFQAVTGWHILDWTFDGHYTTTVMPGWLTLIELETDHHGVPVPTRLQDHYPQRRIVPARLDPFSGRLKDAAINPMFYRILAPDQPEPGTEEVQQHWRLLQALQERQHDDR